METVEETLNISAAIGRSIDHLVDPTTGNNLDLEQQVLVLQPVLPAHQKRHIEYTSFSYVQNYFQEFRQQEFQKSLISTDDSHKLENNAYISYEAMGNPKLDELIKFINKEFPTMKISYNLAHYKDSKITVQKIPDFIEGGLREMKGILSRISVNTDEEDEIKKRIKILWQSYLIKRNSIYEDKNSMYKTEEELLKRLDSFVEDNPNMFLDSEDLEFSLSDTYYLNCTPSTLNKLTHLQSLNTKTNNIKNLTGNNGSLLTKPLPYT
jgi:hypothetical protein